MVFICPTIYASGNEYRYESNYTQFTHELHDFQKWSIEALIEAGHISTQSVKKSAKTKDTNEKE